MSEDALLAEAHHGRGDPVLADDDVGGMAGVPGQVGVVFRVRGAAVVSATPHGITPGSPAADVATQVGAWKVRPLRLGVPVRSARPGTSAESTHGAGCSKISRVTSGSWIGAAAQTQALGGVGLAPVPRSGRGRLRRFHTMYPVCLGLSRISRTLLAIQAPTRWQPSPSIGSGGG